MISKLGDKDLHLATLKAGKNEKAATILLLDHLHEVNRRKLFVDYGYSTLQKYMTKELGLSEGESWTRIQAMRLVASSPVAKQRIESGELPITNAAIIQAQIIDEKLPPSKIDEKVSSAIGKSSRELKNESAKRPEEKKIVLNERLLAKIKKLGWNQSELEVFEALLDEKLRVIEITKSDRATADEDKVSRYIPVETKREVLKRSGHKCEYPGCSERRNLQYDHIRPFALGGDRSPGNIRLLCFSHNQRRAIKTFGIRSPEMRCGIQPQQR
ncbi:MAG TPA: HNH endonuclease signature motif containing protein [Bacteriovoracaceae bacterium]|nr:HNH endonuclease signature motif containing protein [Bacteriovoracaceae bacterium]